MVSNRLAFPGQRAPREVDKVERREGILEAARLLLSSRRYDAVKMADVATEASLAKGTVFFYFPTKEVLFLSLLERELFVWLDVLDEKLSAGRRFSHERVARIS